MARYAPSGPLIVTAELPPALFRWANALRQEHYPAGRNHVPAHVTLFRSLPPSADKEVRRHLAHSSLLKPPLAQITGLAKYERATAIKLHSPQMRELWEDLADRFHGLLTLQDQTCPQFHITIQNKVSAEEARALQRQLTDKIEPQNFAFKALQLHEYTAGKWRTLQNWQFRS